MCGSVASAPGIGPLVGLLAGAGQRDRLVDVARRGVVARVELEALANGEVDLRLGLLQHDADAVAQGPDHRPRGSRRGRGAPRRRSPGGSPRGSRPWSSCPRRSAPAARGSPPCGPRDRRRARPPCRRRTCAVPVPGRIAVMAGTYARTGPMSSAHGTVPRQPVGGGRVDLRADDVRPCTRPIVRLHARLPATGPHDRHARVRRGARGARDRFVAPGRTAARPARRGDCRCWRSCSRSSAAIVFTHPPPRDDRPSRPVARRGERARPHDPAAGRRRVPGALHDARDHLRAAAPAAGAARVRRRDRRDQRHPRADRRPGVGLRRARGGTPSGRSSSSWATACARRAGGCSRRRRPSPSWKRRARRTRRAVQLRERARLAREMHDVLAHSLSALTVQLEGARLLGTSTRHVTPT